MPDPTQLTSEQAAVPPLSEASCIVCGCTEDDACEGGCHWVHTGLMADVCSACAGGHAALAQALRAQLADDVQDAIVYSQTADPTSTDAAARRAGLAQALRIIAPTETTPAPFPLSWDGLVLGPSGDTPDEATLVPCTAPSGYPAALALDDDARLRLGKLLLASLHHAESCTTPGCGEVTHLPLYNDAPYYGWIYVTVHGAGRGGVWWCSPGCAFGAITAAAAAHQELADGDAPEGGALS